MQPSGYYNPFRIFTRSQRMEAQSSNQQVATASLDAQNRYVFEDFRNRGLTDLRENATLFEIRMGIQFEF